MSAVLGQFSKLEPTRETPFKQEDEAAQAFRMQEGKRDELDSSKSKTNATIETSLPPDEGDRRRAEEDVGRKLREAGTGSAELGGRAEELANQGDPSSCAARLHQ